MKAYYFATKDRKLRYGDDRPIKVGETHTVEGDIVLCGNGLHASRRVIDALEYAPGEILYEVELSGTIVKGLGKVAASSRKYIKEVDCTEILKSFARKQALINIELIKPYVLMTEDYELIVWYLETGDELLAAYAADAASREAYVTTAAAYAADAASREADAAAYAAAYAADAASREAYVTTAAAYAADAAAYVADAAAYAADAASREAYAADAASREAYAAAYAREAAREAANEMLMEMIR